MARIEGFPKGFERELAVATELCYEAGRVILGHYAQGFDVGYKDSHGTDPVTQADLDANRIIVEGLAEAFPNDAILAEESRDTAARRSASRLWCVDPLDGTREFVDRNGQFVVMIGLAIDGRAEVGAVYQPTEDRLWWGAAGVAAEHRGGESTTLRVNPLASPSEAVLMVSRSHRSQTVSGVAERLGIGREMPLGSVGLKISRIITGVAHAYVSTTDRTKEWDACAPEAIVRAAGGEMTDCRGAPLRYNKPTPNTPFGMAASNGVLHPKLLRALGPVVEERGWNEGA